MQTRDQLPHFLVRDVTGTVVDYSTIWQRRHLVLACLAPGIRETPAEPSASGVSAAQAYAERLRAACADLAHADITYVVTTDPVPGVPAPGAVVADRWGEVVFVSAADQTAPPAPDDLAAWAKMVAMRCG